MDNGVINGALFLSLRKAFYTVDHEMFVTKLSHSGINGKALAWLRSYWYQRKQYCVVNNATSLRPGVNYGIPH